MSNEHGNGESNLTGKEDGDITHTMGADDQKDESLMGEDGDDGDDGDDSDLMSSRSETDGDLMGSGDSKDADLMSGDE